MAATKGWGECQTLKMLGGCGTALLGFCKADPAVMQWRIALLLEREPLEEKKTGPKKPSNGYHVRGSQFCIKPGLCIFQVACGTKQLPVGWGVPQASRSFCFRSFCFAALRPNKHCWQQAFLLATGVVKGI